MLSWLTAGPPGKSLTAKAGVAKPHAAASKTKHRDAGVFLMLFIVFTFQCLKKSQIHSPQRRITQLPKPTATRSPIAAAAHCAQTALPAPAAHGSRLQSSPARGQPARYGPTPSGTPAGPYDRRFRTRPPTHCLPTRFAHHRVHAGRKPQTLYQPPTAPKTRKARPKPPPESSKKRRPSAKPAPSNQNMRTTAVALPNSCGESPRKSAHPEPSRNEKQDCPR